MVCVCSASWAQTRSGTISGRVIDGDGNPITGATVEVVGTQRGMTTDSNGQFSFTNITDNSATVNVSYVGMSTVSRKINLNRSVTITLQSSDLELEEVVVTGMFDRPGNSFTGAAKTVTAEDLKRVGGGNVFQALRNLDPSINMIDNMQYGSDPNRLPEIELRGQSSFPLSEGDLDLRRMYQNNPNEPLYILDGFEVNATRIYDLDQDRIARISILKDASAKAIYGAKAANGVFVIETKRNTTGEVIATYRGYLNVEMPDLTSYDLTNAREKLEVEMLAGVYTQNTNLNSLLQNMGIYNDHMNMVLAGTDTDWLSKPLRVGWGQKHAVGVEVNERRLSVLGDVSYNNVAGVMKGSNRNTLAGTMDVAYRNPGKFMVKNVINIDVNDSNDSPWGSFTDYVNANPYNDPYDSEGMLIKSFKFPGNTGDEMNPMWNTQFEPTLSRKYLSFTDNFHIEYNPMQNLKLRLRGGVETRRDENRLFYPGQHTRFATESDESRRGRFDHFFGKMTRLSGDFSAMYTKIIDKHTLTGNFNYSLSQNSDYEIQYVLEGFPNASMSDPLFANMYEKDKKPTGRQNMVRDMAFTGLINYDYDTRYLADVTLRSSASSRYSPKKRWGTFWSVGLAWNMHNETWGKELSWLDIFKLRASIGTTGTQNVDAYAFLTTYNFYTDTFYDMGGKNTLDNFGAKIIKLANPNLKWQEKLDTNIGFDATLFGGLHIVADAWMSTTKDLVTDLTLAPSTGYASVKENVGDVENKGLDINLNYRIIDRPDFYLNVMGAVNMTTNKIKKLSDAMREYNERQNEAFEQQYDENGNPKALRTKPVQKFVEGGSMSSIWVVRSLGIDPATGQEVYLNQAGLPSYLYNANDQVIGGNSKEKYRGNFGFNGEWKKIGFNVLFHFIAGGDYYNSTIESRVENIDITRNVDRRVFTDRWSENNPLAPYKAFRVWDERAGEWRAIPKTQASSRFVQKRNELDLSVVSLWYNFADMRVFEEMGFNNLRLTLNMNNLHKFSTIQLERGTDYPFSRAMSLSIYAEF